MAYPSVSVLAQLSSQKNPELAPCVQYQQLRLELSCYVLSELLGYGQNGRYCTSSPLAELVIHGNPSSDGHRAWHPPPCKAFVDVVARSVAVCRSWRNYCRAYVYIDMGSRDRDFFSDSPRQTDALYKRSPGYAIKNRSSLKHLVLYLPLSISSSSPDAKGRSGSSTIPRGNKG